MIGPGLPLPGSDPDAELPASRMVIPIAAGIIVVSMAIVPTSERNTCKATLDAASKVGRIGHFAALARSATGRC